MPRIDQDQPEYLCNLIRKSIVIVCYDIFEIICDVLALCAEADKAAWMLKLMLIDTGRQFHMVIVEPS